MSENSAGSMFVLLLSLSFTVLFSVNLSPISILSNSKHNVRLFYILKFTSTIPPKCY